MVRSQQIPRQQSLLSLPPNPQIHPPHSLLKPFHPKPSPLKRSLPKPPLRKRSLRKRNLPQQTRPQHSRQSLPDASMTGCASIMMRKVIGEPESYVTAAGQSTEIRTSWSLRGMPTPHPCKYGSI